MTVAAAPADTASRFRGCLLGGALGDALGAPIEFLDLTAIQQQFGPEGLTRFAPSWDRKGSITDDTQMTLFTAEGLIRAHNAKLVRGSANLVASLHRAYLRWDHTQREVWANTAPKRDDTSGWLLGHAFLHHPRAPGRTCLSALRADRRGSRGDRLNDSKGCGGVMRVAPIGLVAADPFALAADAAALTHGHPTGYIAAGACASMVAGLARGQGLEDCTQRALDQMRAWPGHEETRLAIEAALRQGREPGAGPEAVARLGEGWIAEEALAIALYCTLKAADLRAGLLLAVNHGGDSDSTGAITGYLMGALHGAEALPEELPSELEGRDVIEQIADDLFGIVHDPERPLDPGRYPPD